MYMGHLHATEGVCSGQNTTLLSQFLNPRLLDRLKGLRGQWVVCYVRTLGPANTAVGFGIPRSRRWSSKKEVCF